MFDLQIIRDDATHEAALRRAERLMDCPNRSSADTKRLELPGFPPPSPQQGDDSPSESLLLPPYQLVRDAG